VLGLLDGHVRPDTLAPALRFACYDQMRAAAGGPLPSLAIGGGDKEVGGTGDEAADVWERDLVCIGTQSGSHPRI
jgi:hypothetical protein